MPPAGSTALSRRRIPSAAPSSGEVMRLMRAPVNYETTEREPHNGYLILQGGLPEVEEFVSGHWK